MTLTTLSGKVSITPYKSGVRVRKATLAQRQVLRAAVGGFWVQIRNNWFLAGTSAEIILSKLRRQEIVL